MIPRLSWSTLIAGCDYEGDHPVAFDSLGRPIICVPAYDPLAKADSESNVLVVKLTADGGGLVWAKSLGGDGSDFVRSLATTSRATSCWPAPPTRRIFRLPPSATCA